MEYNLIALASSELIGINCGIVYSHNAHPAGPTTWAAYQVPDRTMRWLDDEAYILKQLNTTNRFKLQDIGFEQSVYNDAVWSIVSGKPFFAHSMRPSDDRSKMGKWEAFHKSIGPDTVQQKEVRCCAAELCVDCPVDTAVYTCMRPSDLLAPLQVPKRLQDI